MQGPTTSRAFTATTSRARPNRPALPPSAPAIHAAPWSIYAASFTRARDSPLAICRRARRTGTTTTALPATAATTTTTTTTATALASPSPPPTFEPRADPNAATGAALVLAVVAAAAAYWWNGVVPAARRSLAADKRRGDAAVYLEQLQQDASNGSRKVEAWFYTDWLRKLERRQAMARRAEARRRGEEVSGEEEAAAEGSGAAAGRDAEPAFFSLDNPLVATATALAAFSVVASLLHGG